MACTSPRNDLAACAPSPLSSVSLASRHRCSAHGRCWTGTSAGSQRGGRREPLAPLSKVAARAPRIVCGMRPWPGGARARVAGPHRPQARSGRRGGARQHTDGTKRGGTQGGAALKGDNALRGGRHSRTTMHSGGGGTQGRQCTAALSGGDARRPLGRGGTRAR